MPELLEIKGVGPVLEAACKKHGYGSLKAVAAAVVDDLVVIPGVSEARAIYLINSAQSLLPTEPASKVVAASKGTQFKTSSTKMKESKVAKKDKKKDKKKEKKEKKKSEKKKDKNKKTKKKNKKKSKK
jgi:hypothetical protein